MAVGRRDHATQRDTGTVGEQGALGALLAPVYRGLARRLAATGRLDQAAIHGHIAQLRADDAVVAFQTQLLQTFEDPGSDPLVAAPADRGRRTARVGDLVVGRPQHQHLDELVENHPIADAGPMAALGVGVDTLGQQNLELVPEGVDDE